MSYDVVTYEQDKLLRFASVIWRVNVVPSFTQFNMKHLSVLRPAEVAKLLGVCVHTIYYWERKGAFPRRVKLGTKASGWRIADIEQWLANKTGGAREDTAAVANSQHSQQHNCTTTVRCCDAKIRG